RRPARSSRSSSRSYRPACNRTDRWGLLPHSEQKAAQPRHRAWPPVLDAVWHSRRSVGGQGPMRERQKARPAGKRRANGWAMDARLDSHREWFGVPLRAEREAGESPLQQRHQPGIPVTNHKQNQEGNRNEVLVGGRIVNREREITPNQQFDPGNPAEA